MMSAAAAAAPAPRPVRGPSALELALGLIPPLSRSAHKGSGGKVLVVGGSWEYTGAPY
jgi:NAD(P)H-hydrate repair Nnr-like enzyme with NAD(P)H-hydrate dehydratase domain